MHTIRCLLGPAQILVSHHTLDCSSTRAANVRPTPNRGHAAAFSTAAATSVSYAFAGRLAVAAGAAGLAVVAVALRRKIIPMMEALGQQIQQDLNAIPGFRKVHLTAILINIVQMAVIVWSLIAASKPG